MTSNVRTIQNSHPNCGNRQMQGHLASRGIIVQQHRVRDTQRRIGPQGSALRRIRAISRRQYCVPGPGALWHIDGITFDWVFHVKLPMHVNHNMFYCVIHVPMLCV